MASAEVENPRNSLVQRFIPRRKRWRFFVSLALLLLILAAYGWINREDIADNFIADQLEQMGLPATYEVERIGGTRQVLTNIVIGNPDAPDLTIERATVILRYRFGTPAVGRVELEGARLFGSYRGGKLSFGSLDPVIFTDSGEPPALPDLDLKLVDARALIETEYGPVGIKAEGEGELDEGFRGILAASAPELDAGGCEARGASLFGDIVTGAGRLAFDGPVRVAQLSCPSMQLDLRDAALRLDASSDVAFESLEGQGRLSSGALSYAGNRANGIGGTARARWSDGALNSSYSLAMRGAQVPQAEFALLTAKGSYRARDGFARSEFSASVEGNGLRVGSALDDALASGISAGEDSLIAPILRQVRTSLKREERGSTLAADVTVRQTGEITNFVIPSAVLRGGSGASLLSLSRFQISTAGAGPPRIAGNIQTGGEGLPRIAGRMERQSGGNAIFRLRMSEYGVGADRLSIPELVLAQAPSGALGFSGQVLASGALPGGSARNLRVPLDGNWAPDGTLMLWRRCTDLRFDYLAMASLEVENRAITLCPSPQGAIVRSDGGGLRIAAGTPGLDLDGRLAGTPIRIASGPIGFAYPGVATARDLDISLGPRGTASTFRISGLDAQLGRAEFSGTFSDADVLMDAVPLDVLDANGSWRFVDGSLALSDADFRVEDRQAEDRFAPTVARDATLTLENNVIEALATLRNPASDRELTDVAIVHNLSTGIGHANLTIDGLTFDQALQPDRLSELALGVIANARGTITGRGRIDWNGDAVTSSGEFSTQGMDFAAAFGPVRGASGTIVFTDLLNMTTAPGQKLRVESINPGIEVLEGEVEFALRDGQLLSVSGGSWPFMGGRLVLERTDLNFGIEEERRYIFRIVGLEAAQFVQQMELNNLSATGTFDGVVPIVFDAQGNGRIEGGALDSRLPGGNLSYIGELTYEDMGAITNFAFGALRSLDYKTMTIRMEGPLAGEIVSRVRVDGVTQGAGATQNLITRQIADIPIRFNINIRAQFYKLINDIKFMYDPVSTMDPARLKQLLDGDLPAEGFLRPEPEAIKPEDIVPDEPPIQTQESESMP